MAEIKLPKPASSATDAELEAYIPQFHESGDRRVLAVEIIRLRKLADAMFEDLGTGDWGKQIRTQKPERRGKDAPKEEDSPLI